MNISEETIDSFLRGDLAGSELEQFNQALRSDPKLQQEVSLQSDIVDSIKQYRHSQLKNRLNSIEVAPVSTSSYFSAYIKLAASIGAVALLIGSYAILTNKKTEDAVSSSITSTEQISAAQTTEEQTSSNKIAVAASDLEPVNNNASAPVSSKNATTVTVANKSDVKGSKKADLSQTNEPATATQETVFSEEMAGDEESFASGSENMTIPGANHDTHSNTSTSVKVNIVKEKNILAYRFFNNELYLHGNFSNSPYELFELNNKPSKQLFLYFENNYYELVQGKTKVTTLVPITDKATLSQLAQLRVH